jgi:protein arginine N-methyltransferase 1
VREHARYLRDRARLDAFARALAEVARDRVVVDLGAGTGVLGMIACRAGARRVYAIEADPIAALARTLVRDNGLDDRIAVIRNRAAEAMLPERAGVIVCDQIGRFGVDSDILTLMRDARLRFLAADGVLVPNTIDIVVAPIEHPSLARRVFDRAHGPAGLAFAAFERMMTNTVHPVTLRQAHVLGAPVPALSLDLMRDPPMPLRGEATFDVVRPGVLHGMGAWFEARLSPSVTMTNAPDAPERIRRQAACFPVAEPVPVETGDTVAVALRLLPSAPVHAWEVTVNGGGRVRATFRHSTLEGSPIDPADVRRPDARPRLTPYGDARATVFAMCDGRATVADIERAVFDRHRALFASEADAAAFVAGVLARNARREG